MKFWHKSKSMNFGNIVFRWRQRNTNRFYYKILSWVLAAFIGGIFSSIICAALGIFEHALLLSRITFLIIFVAGCINSYFIYVVYGSECRLTERALVVVRPVIGHIPLAERLGTPIEPFAARYDYLPWEEIKDVKEQEGQLLLILKKDLQEVQIGVTPVAFVARESAERSSSESLRGGDENRDKEILKLIVQKVRELKRIPAGKA
jgi:hypothetical protein